MYQGLFLSVYSLVHTYSVFNKSNLSSYRSNKKTRVFKKWKILSNLCGPLRICELYWLVLLKGGDFHWQTSCQSRDTCQLRLECNPRSSPQVSYTILYYSKHGIKVKYPKYYKHWKNLDVNSHKLRMSKFEDASNIQSQMSWRQTFEYTAKSDFFSERADPFVISPNRRI